MNRFLKAAVIFAAICIFTTILAATGSPAFAEQAARTILAPDISGSSTFLVDQKSADAAGAFVEEYIAGLAAPHGLQMVSVGDASLGRRPIDVKATVTMNRATDAKKMARQFGGYFRSLPGLAASGKVAPQGTTSLIAFFQSLEPVCAAGNVTVIVFSDGLEWSSTVDGRAFAAGKVSLPKPDSAFLKGCSVQLLGVGEVKATLDGDGLAARLIPQWRAFLTEAGAEPVAVIGSGFAY